MKIDFSNEIYHIKHFPVKRATREPPKIDKIIL